MLTTINSVSVLLEANMGLAERLTYGLQVFCVGILTVFAALIILWIVLLLFKVFMYDIPNRKANEKKLETEANIQKSPAAEASAAQSTDPTTAGNDEIIAAITAAISAYTSQSANAGSFRVVSYRRKGSSGWSGINDNTSI